MRGQDFAAAWSIQRKYFLAPFKSICTLPTETFPSLHRKYFWTYRENILSRLEQFLCNATNQVWQIRLCWLQPPWHIYCAPKFETLVNLSFHSYTFCHASLQKQKDSETYSPLPTTQMIASDLFVKMSLIWLIRDLNTVTTHPSLMQIYEGFVFLTVLTLAGPSIFPV